MPSIEAAPRPCSTPPASASSSSPTTLTMASLTLQASRIAALVVDNALTALQVRAAFVDLAHRIGEDFHAVSKPRQQGTAADHAFSDDADFDDGAQFSDQGGGTVMWLATLSNDNQTAITRDNSGAIGAASMAIIVNGSRQAGAVALPGRHRARAAAPLQGVHLAGGLSDHRLAGFGVTMLRGFALGLLLYAGRFVLAAAALGLAA